MVRVKICGVTRVKDALLACELGADAIGLNFYPGSPRCVSPANAERILRELPPLVSVVGVFVNWTPAPVIALCRALGFHAAQLHGDESAGEVAELAQKIPVIKALRIGRGAARPNFRQFSAVSAFLLDAQDANHFGGTGQTTDWKLAAAAARSHRILLAGGLTPANVARAIRLVRPYAVDVASGVESDPGRKDPAKLRSFFAELARVHEAR